MDIMLIDTEASVSGTSLQGYIKTTYSELVDVFEEEGTRAAGSAEFPSAVRSCDGILQRGIAHAFDRAASSGGGFEYSFSVSLTEIYNE